MGHIEIAPWEPEESVGKIWHFLASRMDPPRRYPDAAVRFDDMRGRIAVLFRGLGGAADVELKPVADQASRHRISLRRKLAFETEHLARASFDGGSLRLPMELAVFPDKADNEALFLWLAAASAHAPDFVAQGDPFLADLAAIRAGGVHALAHITGGGITENLPRVLPKDLGADIDLSSWTLPPVFRWLAQAGGIDQAEMLKTFNSGIGMILSVAADRADALTDLLSGHGETVHRLGRVTAGPGVRYSGQLA